MRFIQRHEGQHLIVRGVAIKIWAAQNGRVLLGLADVAPDDPDDGEPLPVCSRQGFLAKRVERPQLRLFDPDRLAA